jgi:hypothetical protein
MTAVEVVEEDETEFRPMYEALAALEEGEFPVVIAQLDELPYPVLSLPADLPVASFYVGGELVTVPPDARVTNYDSTCSADLGCYRDPLIVILGESAVVFELTGPELLGVVRDPAEARLEPLMSALERATVPR